jgi:hypothetical protein
MVGTIVTARVFVITAGVPGRRNFFGSGSISGNKIGTLLL